MKLGTRPFHGLVETAQALDQLERLVATVKGKRKGKQESNFSKALAVLETLARKEDIPLAIVGGLAAIHHGYERFTKDIDVVAPKLGLSAITRVAPKYGLQVIWNAPDGWHKLHYRGVDIDIVPEGAKPRRDAPTTIPGPSQLGVLKGAGYAHLPGWMETKLGSNRTQDRADVVQVMKKCPPASLMKVRRHMEKVDPVYLHRFDELRAAAEEEKLQERERGGPR